MTLPIDRSAPLPRSVAGLVGGITIAFLLTVVLSALLAPWIWELLDALAPGRFGFQRTLRRVAMLVALVALVIGLRRAGVRRFGDVGLARGPGRGQQAAVAFAVAFVGIAVAFAAELGLGHREPSLAELTAGRAAQAALGATAVGLLEEGVCRGALLFPFAPFSAAGLVAANTTTSALFSTAHFLRGGEPPVEVDVWSGFSSWAALPHAVANGIEPWVALFLTGAVLYQLAYRQGHAWGAVGAHTGAVFALQALGTATAPVAGRDALFLANGLLPGWGMSALLAATMLVLALLPARTRSG